MPATGPTYVPFNRVEEYDANEECGSERFADRGGNAGRVRAAPVRLLSCAAASAAACIWGGWSCSGAGVRLDGRLLGPAGRPMVLGGRTLGTPAASSRGVGARLLVARMGRMAVPRRVLALITRTARRWRLQIQAPDETGKVTIAGHPSDDVAPGTLNSIRKQAGPKK